MRVHAADSSGLRLSAEGPISLDVTYGLRPVRTGSEVSASVSVRKSRGLSGRVVAKATEAMLAAGALQRAAARIAETAEGAGVTAVAA